MPKHKCKNSNNNIQGNISPPEPNNPIKASPEYFNAMGAQENNLKPNLWW